MTAVLSPNLVVGRRQFLRLVALSGVAAGLGAGLTAALRRGRAQAVSVTRIVMGAIANLTLITLDRANAEAAIDAAYARMNALEDVFSRFRPSSELSRLNRAGWLADPHPALREVIEQAIYYGHLTRGVFDVTVEPLLTLYREGAKVGIMPDAEAVARARMLIDYRQIVLGDTIHLAQADMALTLDGIAKGYVIDQGAAVIRERGFPSILVEVGGDLHAQGQTADRPWQIGIQASADGGIAAAAQLVDQALATSGDYLNAFDADRRLHHILDPRTGESPPALSSASITAPTVCAADALSTAVLALGPDDGLSLVESLPQVEAYLITKDRQTLHSSGFPLL